MPAFRPAGLALGKIWFEGRAPVLHQSAVGLEMELDRMPRLMILNKWDQLEAPARAELADAFPDALTISAKNGEGCKALLEELELLLLRHPASMVATDAPTVPN